MLLRNARIATLGGSDELIDRGAVAIRGAVIEWVGAEHDLPTDQFNGLAERDLQGKLITPGLVDCHTHIIHAGNRAREFEMRLNGASYEDIARAGGGILSTVAATRAADVDALVQAALPRIDALLSEGVTTLEIKSGYGLDRDTELNMLRAARLIGERRHVQIRTSFLGAHAIPPDYRHNADAYIDDVCIPTLKEAHAEKLVDAVDGFCEGIAFNAEQIRRVFETAASLNLPVKLHAEQLTHQGGTQLASEFAALSVDHLEYCRDDDVTAMRNAGSAAVLLPGAFYTLQEKQVPPIDCFREHGVPMAVATDCNPGSSPLTSILLCMNFACILFQLTPQEVLAGVTRNATKALGLHDIGQIQTGMRADLAVWDVEHPAELVYRIGFNPLSERIFAGESSAL
ncbi:MAG: imidazolonepropionase [Pirellulales bacterium]|nr:imidazolonepropionase [Pirellulales bacterium]